MTVFIIGFARRDRCRIRARALRLASPESAISQMVGADYE